MRAFCWIDFALDTIRLHKPEVGTEEPIYSQALLLEPRHGLPPPPPQIALRFAAQIKLEGQKKIQATALRAVRTWLDNSQDQTATGPWLQRSKPQPLKI